MINLSGASANVDTRKEVNVSLMSDPGPQYASSSLPHPSGYLSLYEAGLKHP
jgi:hypothetical protein